MLFIIALTLVVIVSIDFQEFYIKYFAELRF